MTGDLPSSAPGQILRRNVSGRGRRNPEFLNASWLISFTVSGMVTLFTFEKPLDGADIRFQGLQVTGAQDGAAVTLPTVSDTLASATYADGSDATHILIAPASQPPI